VVKSAEATMEVAKETETEIAVALMVERRC
jgi:hypothetical protein